MNIDITTVPSCIEWRGYIDGLEDAWQRELEETCWEIFQDIVQRTYRVGVKPSSDVGGTSVFRGVGKSGLALERSYNPIDERRSLFDEVAERAAKANIFTRGPMGSRGKGRALFMLDPDGNETEVNTRYLYGVPKR